MKNVDKFEQEEEYDNLLYFVVVPSIQNAIEESIRNGEWYKQITYEIDELKDYDEETIDNITDDIYKYDGGDFTNEGFKVDMQFNGYVLTYYITVDTDVNQGHLDYHLMDKLMDNGYLNHIEDIENYIKAFGDDKTLTVDHDGKEIIVKDPEQHAKVTFYIDDWGKWEHTMERMEN